MKKIVYYIIVFFIAACWYSCTEEGHIFNLDSNAPAPAQVTNLTVVNNPGGAILTYKIPNDSNLSYVKAVYEIQPGVFREAKSSYYNDTLSLVGYGDTLSHQVKIYSVGRNEKASAPLLATIKPLIPPVMSIKLTMDPTFGGVSINFTNTSKTDLAIIVMKDSVTIQRNSTDTIEHHNWFPYTTFYTAAQNGNVIARGLAATQRNFAVYVRDRWNNKSDTLIASITPWYEELIPKTPWKALHLANDSWVPSNANLPLENMWNGQQMSSISDLFEPKDQVTTPQWFTVDLGQTVTFSRMKLFQRYNYWYNSSWVKSFEIWGATSYDADGNWSKWTRLGKFDGVIPSGSVWPAYTADDKAYEINGEDYTFDQPQPQIRYLRFKLLDTYGGSGKYWISELTFWGQIAN